MAGLGTFLASELEPDKHDENCPLQCFNGGECIVHETTSEFYCGCDLFPTGGFMGVHCETPFQECNSSNSTNNRGWRCLNGGMCQNGDGGELCHCLDEWGGQRCEIFLGLADRAFIHHAGLLSEDNPLTVEAIVIIVAASLVLSFVCFLGGFHVGRGKRAPVDLDAYLDEDLPGDYLENDLQLKTVNTEPVNSHDDEEEGPEQLDVPEVL
mmetsp:Transcript_16351/g.33681  ORF Transcript_16351/g.33681 Transcript_16351/m.33681 type:complete len:210 (-) Transcript_16351:312-941(-)